MQFRLDRTSLWLCWIMVVTCAFTLVPVGPYGLTGWMAAAGPLTLVVWPQFTTRRWLMAGLLFMLGLALVPGEPIAWYESMAALVVMLLGTVLVMHGSSDLRALAKYAGTQSATLGFRQALARELGRTRRHERPLSLLSAAFTQPHHAQCLPHLSAALASELHVYCQVFVVEGRVLAIVPELATTAQRALLDRLTEALRIRGMDDVDLGCAAFPQAGLTSAALISAADNSRRTQEFTPQSRTNGATALSNGTDGKSELPGR